MTFSRIAAIGFLSTVLVSAASAGVLDPECTAEKAAKSAAMKATVGVGGRCTAKEAAGDTAKRAAGIEDKGPLEKRGDEGGVAKKAVDAVKN